MGGIYAQNIFIDRDGKQKPSEGQRTEGWFGLSQTCHNVLHLRVFLLVIVSALNAPPPPPLYPCVNSFQTQLSCHLLEEVFITLLPQAESIGPTWCSHGTFYILLSQKWSDRVELPTFPFLALPGWNLRLWVPGRQGSCGLPIVLALRSGT